MQQTSSDKEQVCFWWAQYSDQSKHLASLLLQVPQSFQQKDNGTQSGLPDLFVSSNTHDSNRDPQHQLGI